MTVILIPVADRPECIHALNVAFELAQRLPAHVVGCHLRPHRHDSKSLRTTGGERAAKSARALFTDIAGPAGFDVRSKARVTDKPTAYWQEMLGSPERVMPIISPVSDMVVVSRPKSAAKGARAKTANRFVMQALLGSGRPTLVLPQRRITSLGQRVMIAWDQSASAMNAVVGSLPILRTAETVHIHAAGTEYQAAPKTHHVTSYLAMHGIKATQSHSKGLKVEAELEDAIGDCGADLLVMGGYSRSRLLERTLGGTSEHFIMKSTLPVLATHLITG